MLRPPRALYTQARVRVYVPQEGEGFSPRARDFLPPSPHIEKESCRYSRASFLPAPLPLLPFARFGLRLFRAPTRDRSILRAVIFARDAFARSAPCVFFSPFLRAHPLYWIPRVSRARTRTFIPRGIFFGRGAAALSGSIGPREARETRFYGRARWIHYCRLLLWAPAVAALQECRAYFALCFTGLFYRKICRFDYIRFSTLHSFRPHYSSIPLLEYSVSLVNKFIY